MTNVQVPATWIEQGYLPQVCARHGGPASTTTSRNHFTRSSRWLLLLVLVSWLIALIVMLATRKSVRGPLPVCRRCIQERQRYLAATWAVWLLTLVFAGCAMASIERAWIFAWLFLLALLTGLVLLAVKDRTRVVGTLDNALVWVELRGVDPSFARLINQAVQANPAQGTGNGHQPQATGATPPQPRASSAAPGATILPGG